jgi:hypothetical protein
VGALGRLVASVKGSIGRDRARAATGARPAGGAAGPRGADLHAGTDGIEVSYAPDLDGDPDPGEVVWAWVPFEEDPSQGKDRPVLVVGHDGPLLAAVQLSSKDHSQRQDHGEWVEVGRGAWDREGRVSYVDAERLLRLEPSAVRREGAILDRPRFDAVLARVITLHGWRP